MKRTNCSFEESTDNWKGRKTPNWKGIEKG